MAPRPSIPHRFVSFSDNFTDLWAGGYTIEYDCELKSFYQQPSNAVWIFDPSVGKWAMGAPLPKASLGTTDKTISFRGYCFGQASSHAGFIYYSGGATLAVNNTYKTRESGPLNKYEYVSYTKVMRLDPNTEDWAQVIIHCTDRFT